jgi:hypothetical protein
MTEAGSLAPYLLNKIEFRRYTPMLKILTNDLVPPIIRARINCQNFNIVALGRHTATTVLWIGTKLMTERLLQSGQINYFKNNGPEFNAEFQMKRALLI